MAMPDGPSPPRWSFYLPDDDRSTGWTNHGYVLQFVCSGIGGTPAKAWENLTDPVPEQFVLPDQLVAIRDDAEISFVARERPADRVDDSPTT